MDQVFGDVTAVETDRAKHASAASVDSNRAVLLEAQTAVDQRLCGLDGFPAAVGIALRRLETDQADCDPLALALRVANVDVQRVAVDDADEAAYVLRARRERHCPARAN